MSSGFMKTGLLTIENRMSNMQRDRRKQALISVFPPLHFYYFLRNICHALSFRPSCTPTAVLIMSNAVSLNVLSTNIA